MMVGKKLSRVGTDRRHVDSGLRLWRNFQTLHGTGKFDDHIRVANNPNISISVAVVEMIELEDFMRSSKPERACNRKVKPIFLIMFEFNSLFFNANI